MPHYCLKLPLLKLKCSVLLATYNWLNAFYCELMTTHCSSLRGICEALKSTNNLLILATVHIILSERISMHVDIKDLKPFSFRLLLAWQSRGSGMSVGRFAKRDLMHEPF